MKWSGTTYHPDDKWPCGHPRTLENTQSVGIGKAPRCRECRNTTARESARKVKGYKPRQSTASKPPRSFHTPHRALTSGGVPCPICSSASEVLDSRRNEHSDVRRRRKCMTCGTRFTTLESVEVQRDKEREEALRMIINRFEELHALILRLQGPSI